MVLEPRGYAHPYERGHGLVEAVWPDIVAKWPGIELVGPCTAAGERLRDRLTQVGELTVLSVCWPAAAR